MPPQRLFRQSRVTNKEIILGGYVRQQDSKGRVIAEKEIASYALMPGGVKYY